MSSALIELGVRQGSILAFKPDITEKSDEFKELEKSIKTGRYGLFEPKGVTKKNLYAVLTQDCSISSGKVIELAQLKPHNLKDPSKAESIFLGKNYSKIYLNYDGEFYEAEESLLTKVNCGVIHSAITDGSLILKKPLPNNDIRILLDWRTLAYFREPYPDNFNRTLGEYLCDKGKWFVDFLKEKNSNIHSVRIFVSPEDQEQAQEYKFSITALLTTEGEEIQEYISSLLEKMVNELNSFGNITCLQIEGCESSNFEYPEHLTIAFTSTLDEFTFANAYVMREYNFQYVCYDSPNS
ncbi:hypothetical protein FCV66_12855 [Enterovibrio norvegicus]|uniref:hypothetical protein n=1 Tax=Enterovibrio norvegicus TaxID=188144 RepID=UPI0010BEA654|nr:hypothetical protein [Enterovibrio norvegicus]TKF13711.1 hypothetical protein FCV66_12855 [Enterovibrio norvegicus]